MKLSTSLILFSLLTTTSVNAIAQNYVYRYYQQGVKASETNSIPSNEEEGCLVLPNGIYETRESFTEMGEDRLRNELESMNIAYQDPISFIYKDRVPLLAGNNPDYKKGIDIGTYESDGVKTTISELQVCGDSAPENSVWREYAVSNEIRFEEDFSIFLNMSEFQVTGGGRLPALPTENYPNKNVINIMIKDANINSIGGLSSIESVSRLDLSGNNLTEINFPFLEEMKGGESFIVKLDLSNNELITLDGLSSLRILDGDLFLDNNSLTDISGLSNLNVDGYIYIDNEYSGSKLDATTTFCEENSPYQFENSGSHQVGVHATKDMVCESPIIEGPDS